MSTRVRAPRVTRFLITVVLCAGSLARAMCAYAQTTPVASDGWHFSLSPYVWLPTINARIDYPYPGIGGGGGGGSGSGGGGSTGGPGGVIESEIGPNQYLTHLNFALMLAGEARRGPWSVAADFIGLSASGEGSALRGFQVTGGGQTQLPISSALNSGTETTVRSVMLTVTAGYELLHSPQLQIGALVGVRSIYLDATLSWNLSGSVSLPNGEVVLNRSGSAEASRTPVDGLIGARGVYRMSEHWSLPFYVDVGTGSNQLDWQASGAISYAFGWGDVALSYRYLELKDDNQVVFRRFTLGGPMLGATFRF